MTSSESQTAQDVNIDKQRLGAVYAKALLGVTERSGQSEAVLEELNGLVDEVLKMSPDLDATLASPRIASAEKSALLDRIFQGRLSEQTLTFLKVVAQHHRLDCIHQIRNAMRDELTRLRHRLLVRVTMAEPIQDDLKWQVRQQLQARLGSEVELICQTDPAIIGGMVVRVGDTVFDGSVANQLARLKEETINKTYLQLRESIDRFATTG